MAWLVATGCSRDTAETRRLLARATQTYQQLGARLAELQGTLSRLHDDVEALAAALPAGKELRARYFTTEEVLGVIDGKMKWLSGEIAVAEKSPQMDRALAIKDALASTGNELADLSKAAVEIVHESSRLQRVAALIKTPERFGAFNRILANGFAIKGADDGVEAGLLGAIEDPGRKAGKVSWVDLDRVFFVRQSADLDVPLSRAQLDNVSQILKAHPSVKLEIGGYGSGTAADKRLSQQRVRAVMQALVQMGVVPARLRATALPMPAAGQTARTGGVSLRMAAK